MQPRQEFFQVRERTLTTFTHVTLPDNLAIRAQHVSDRTTYQDSKTAITLLQSKLNEANLEAMQLRQSLLATQQALHTSQESLCSAEQALYVSHQTLKIIQQVSTTALNELNAENQSLHLKLSLFNRPPVQAIVLSPSPSGASTSAQPPVSTP